MDTSHMRRPARWNKQVVDKKVKRHRAELPDEVAQNFKGLTYPQRKEYAKELFNGGWTLQAIANAIGNLTRERVRQVTKEPRDEESYLAISHLLVPELPTVDVVKHVPIKLDPAVLKKLLELKDKAFWVRGTSSKYRQEAEEYVKMLAQLIEEGHTTYTLAKQLGVTAGAINFRLCRYGYKTAKGKSRVYRTVTNRPKPKEVN